MATWKKLIVSGSDISQLNDDLGVHLSGSAGGAVENVGSVTLGSTGSLAVRYDSTYITSSGAGQGQLSVVSASIDTSRIAQDTIVVSQISASALVTSSVGGGEGLSPNTTGSDDKLPTAKSVVEYVESQVGAANDLKVSGSDGTSTTVDLSDDIVFVTSGSDGSILTNISEATNTASIAISVNTGSDHFISGSRKTISVTDTQGGSGIDLSYDSGNGILSASLQTASFVLGETGIELGTTASAVAGLTGSNFHITSSYISSSTLVEVEGSGSFSGSFQGDGSRLTGIRSGLNITASYNGTAPTSGSVHPTGSLTIQGFQNEISASFQDPGDILQIRLPEDVTVRQDLKVERNLTVLGTASFQHSTNLEIADRFILLASGSNTPGDGGIVVQQQTQDIGHLFGFESGSGAVGVEGDFGRWAINSNFHASASSFDPEGFMATVLASTETNPNTAGSHQSGTQYAQPGNLHVSTTDETIWIYS
jgi:hypothetical protein